MRRANFLVLLEKLGYYFSNHIGVAMKFILLAFLSLLFACAHGPQISSKDFNLEDDAFSIMQGATDDRRTVINVVVPYDYQYTIAVTDSLGNKLTNIREEKIIAAHSPWVLVNTFIDGLKLGEEYTYSVTAKNEKYHYSDKRKFSAIDLKKKDWKLFIASCMNDNLHDEIGVQVWPRVYQKNADAYFLIGDFIYSDFFNGKPSDFPVDKQHYWNRFMDARWKLLFLKQRKLTPVFATWDDHDYGTDNGDRHFKLKDYTLKHFRLFFPMIKSEALETGPGMSFNLKLGENRFYFLDNRYFRDSDDDKNGAHLGKAQLNWLEKTIKTQSDNANFLILGDQFFGKNHSFESYEGNHPVEFEKFLKILSETKTPSTFISGDRHYLELMKLGQKFLGYTLYEMTTSSIHAKIFPKSFELFTNPRRIGGADDQYNYVIAEIKNTDPGKTEVSYKGYNEKDDVLVDFKFNL